MLVVEGLQGKILVGHHFGRFFNFRSMDCFLFQQFGIWNQDRGIKRMHHGKGKPRVLSKRIVRVGFQLFSR